MEVLEPTGRVRQAPPFSIGPGGRLLSCNFPSYQQVMLLPIWRGKEGVFVSWGLVANATRLEACWLYREQWLLSL